MSGRDGRSEYYEVQGRGKKPYKVTINYDTGNWCTCRGMISMKSSWGDDAGRTAGTSCKHVRWIISEKKDGDWGIKNSDGSRTPVNVPNSPIPAPSAPSGRRAAIEATRAKRALEASKSPGGGSLLDRIAGLESAREGVSN